MAQVELMFLGEYRHSIDDKGRLTVPARFRQLLEDGGYINQGLEPNFQVWPKAKFEAMAASIDDLPYPNQEGRDFGRRFFSSADRVQVDSSGRILLPQFLREKHGLNGEVVLVGVGKFFEIWLPDQWEAHGNPQRDPSYYNKLSDLMKKNG